MSSDRDLILNHLARYCFAVDEDDADTIAALFWDDAVLEFDGIHRGRDAIRQCFAAWIRHRRDPVTSLRHLLHQPLVDIDGDGARARSYVDADALTRRSGRAVHLRAVYEDRLQRRAGEWRFAARRIVVLASFTAPRSGA